MVCLILIVRFAVKVTMLVVESIKTPEGRKHHGNSFNNTITKKGKKNIPWLDSLIFLSWTDREGEKDFLLGWDMVLISFLFSNSSKRGDEKEKDRRRKKNQF